MSRVRFILVCVCMVSLTAGCQTRCNPGGGLFAGNTTVAPPATYSLNIPSVASNQPYYTPGSAPTNRTLNPNQQAPTPATGQPGWRATDGAGVSNGGQGSTNDGRSVLTSQTKFVETQPGYQQLNPGNQPPPRLAALPGTGVSFTNSQNYQSTQFDERADATRLPVTDASAVRAPARNFPTGNVPQYQRPTQGIPAQQTFVAQNPTYPMQSGYVGNTLMVGGQPAAYQGQAVLMNPGFYAPNATVQAQATAGLGSGSASQVGWRAREMNSDRVERY